MGWYKSENGDSVRPAVIDRTSSKVFVYVRKDIQLIEAEGDRPAHYEWMELKVPKSSWDVYEMVVGHDDALDDVYAALTELADLIAG